MLIIKAKCKGQKNPHIIKIINMDKNGNCKSTKIEARDLEKKLSEYERETVNE